MNITSTVPLVLILCITSACTTTGASREKAAELSKRVASYEADQQARINEVNARYRRTFEDSLERLDELLLFGREVGEHLKHQTIADDLAGNWAHRAFPSVLAELFGGYLDTELEEIRRGDAVIAEAKATYAKGVDKISLELKKLAAVRKSLDLLAQPDTSFKRLSAIFGALREIREAVKKASSPAPASSSSTSSFTNSGGNS